ncbi:MULTISPECIES: DUF2065 domain-containing protein [sulfur-oxidizing symbionts]|uniref:DUF2065 domain-containing protein n=2 Tax=sulfur-oxidizing symbionts TaxID=32036 RepID=A0A0B0HBW7_SOVGS|nr:MULTISPECIES: DUF2065 domain-containing protein [sulfur-oxidizing symbionts]KHF26167.1 hypothetical protein JV46_15120 [Solemya velum gill symbiont]OOY35887.1 hypothetical protein BOV88_02255 [Solemya velum gill symbiont]OOY38727.1 hypothetical protein BOV89_00425 [Solemya velum gill symbiont]OOY39263.1 hypothetical protein BOV90_10275 [Solemya velum gill symbiont]OOY41243.1 hypothetical protein BOV91_12500 [Solemya velum gill symbiont]
MQDLWAALALLMIIEGIFPFLSPQKFRETMRKMSDMDDNSMRTAGIISMIAGLVLLYLVRL